jgi:pimeloyl-ACP methyl ester carboxylesterase
VRGRAVAAAVVLAVGVPASLTACSVSAGVTSERADRVGGSDDGEQSIAWDPCPSAAMVELECSSLTVPLDYEDPDGGTIEVAVARVPATGDDRIGSLVFNPGGPGGSGIEFLEAAALLVPDELARRFDLVSFDPRGVGSSTAVDCDVPFDDEITLLEEGDDAGWDALVADAEALPESCTAETLAIGGLLGTNNAARDLDRLREAVGDDGLSYVGFSYGTRLGATYAELFPDRVRALVLDGAVKPTDDFGELDAGQAAGFDRAFEAFAAACDRDRDCGLADVGPVLEVYRELRADVASAGSLPTDDGRDLTPGELELAVIAAMYTTQFWPILADGMRDAALDGDGTLLHALVDSYLGRQPDGSYDNSQVAGFTINCADDAERPPDAEIRRDAASTASRSEYFDDFLRASTGCIGGPDPVDPLIVGPASGAPPILVIGTTGDPATPYEWAVELADYLESGELFTVEADGHTAFLSVPCVEPIVVDYLVDLAMPEPGSSCAAETGSDDTADLFPPAGSSEFEQVIALFDCLRENGADVPEIDIADLLADPSGEELLDSIDPTDPSFGAAVLACADLIPDS